MGADLDLSIKRIDRTQGIVVASGNRIAVGRFHHLVADRPALTAMIVHHNDQMDGAPHWKRFEY